MILAYKNKIYTQTSLDTLPTVQAKKKTSIHIRVACDLQNFFSQLLTLFAGNAAEIILLMWYINSYSFEKIKKKNPQVFFIHLGTKNNISKLLLSSNLEYGIIRLRLFVS